MAGAFDGGGYAALILEAVARNAAREEFALLVDELEQELRVFVVDVFDAEFAEAAVFFASQTDFRVTEKFYVFSRSSHIVGDELAVKKWVEQVSAVLFGFLVEVDYRGRCNDFRSDWRSNHFLFLLADASVALVVVVLDTVFVEFDRQETQ